MGTELAIVYAVKAYPFVAVMSNGNSIERSRMMKFLGAEVILVDQAWGSVPGQVSGEDLKLVEARAQERGAFRADQFLNRRNVHSHEYGTALEIWEQTDGAIDVFIDWVVVVELLPVALNP